MLRGLLVLGALLLFASDRTRADQFDHYINPVLSKAIEGPCIKEVKELTTEQLAQYADVLADTSAVFVIVNTNENRFAKLLVRPARQRFGTDRQVAMILIEKYTTYREASERTVKAKGENLHLYGGSRLNLDLGQVVPEKLDGDLLAVEGEKNAITLKPVGQAKMYVLTKPIPDVVPKKGPKLVVGAQFDPRYFIGSYKLYDDGRRSGQLKLEVNESGEVSGAFYSDRDGAKYDVTGKIGNPKHAITFTIKFPATEQTFTGFLFTGNGKAITGSTKLQDREAGFYAERIEE